MNFKQLLCHHKWSKWIPAITANKDRRWCIKCGKAEERRVI